MLFLDSSALVFAYLDSFGLQQSEESETVAAALDATEIAAVSTLALPETTAAFTQLAEAKRITSIQALAAHRQLLEDWPGFYRVRLTSDLAKEAAALARSRKLRGADSVHLATVAWLSRERRGVRMLAFDERLNEAARGLVKLWGE